MKDEKWFPRNTEFNIYNQPEFVKPQGNPHTSADDIRI